MNFKAVSWVLGCFLLAQGWPAMADDAAAAAANPYAVISERNVFHLNPPPPPPAPEEPPKADLPDIKLSGFLKIGKTTHALFSSFPKDKKDLPTYYDLVDGEKQGILEVVKIHEDKGEVEIINSGTAATLSLKDDSLEAKTPTEANAQKRERHMPFGPPGIHQAEGSQAGHPFGFSIPPRRTRYQQ
jgi:hypothetical protein